MRADRLAGRSALGDADDHPVRGVEELRLQHDHLPRRAAGIPEDLYEAARIDGASCVAAAPPHHPADAGARRSLLVEHPHHGRLFPALRRALRDDAGRAAAKHRERALPHVRRRLQVVEPRLRLRGGVPAVRDDVRRHHALLVRFGNAGERRHEAARSRRALVNGAAHRGCTASACFRCVWMLSVSFMPPGEASAFPAAAAAGRADARTTTASCSLRAGMGRYFAQQPAARHRGARCSRSRSTPWPATPSPSCSSPAASASFAVAAGRPRHSRGRWR